jgi:hypothetical protein
MLKEKSAWSNPFIAYLSLLNVIWKYGEPFNKANLSYTTNEKFSK